MHVVLVGDKDQLPSVSPGQVFHDLLSFSEIPRVELTNIHRQAADSTIIPLAHAIKEGHLPADLTNRLPDRSFIKCHAPQVPSIINQIINLSAKRGYTAADVQILAPMYRGQAGIDNLNQLAQQAYNPPAKGKQEVEFRGQTFRVGDKVLQLVNSPENNVFNGDIGQITAVETGAKKGGKRTDTITIDFDGNEVNYGRQEWTQIRLAYCISIHKAQGSQFKMVLLPLVHQFSRMLQRNLVYTAVTRAAEKLVLIGEPAALVMATQHTGENRQTSLPQRLATVWQRHDHLKSPLDKSNVNERSRESSATPQTSSSQAVPLSNASKEPESNDQSTVLTAAMVANQEVDPMIGMAGLTPYNC